ncbi:hypothetical protein [Pandoraea pnomenusa]|uniref:hypothetical protein n=1 Tax=Pandoraea pnomenusa TaxID=93220 RepID=UPI003340760A
MSDSSHHPSPTLSADMTSAASVASVAPAVSATAPTPPSPVASSGTASLPGDSHIAQYERMWGEIQLAGRRLQRQMQAYQAAFDDIRRLEQTPTPEARAKLERLDALLNSEPFRREAREIDRMSTALVRVIERLRAQSPAPQSGDTAAAPVRAPAMRRACA